MIYVHILLMYQRKKNSQIKETVEVTYFVHDKQYVFLESQIVEVSDEEDEETGPTMKGKLVNYKLYCFDLIMLL